MKSFAESNELSVRKTTVLILENENRGHLEECKKGVEATCPVDTTIVIEQTDDDTGVPGAINRALKNIGDDDDVMILSSDVVRL